MDEGPFLTAGKTFFYNEFNFPLKTVLRAKSGISDYNFSREKFRFNNLFFTRQHLLSCST